MNSIKSKHTWNIRHRRKYQLLYKSEIPRIFTFSASRRVIILANNLPCFYAMFPLIADTTYTEGKHKFIPNSLMTSNKHLTYPLLDKVPGMEETEFTEGGTKMCCLFALALIYERLLPRVLCFDFSDQGRKHLMKL